MRNKLVLIMAMAFAFIYTGCDSLGEDIGPAAGKSREGSVTVYVNGTFFDNDGLRDEQGGIWVYPGAGVDFNSKIVGGHAGIQAMEIDNTHGYCEVAVFLKEGIHAGLYRSLSFWAKSVARPIEVTVFTGKDSHATVNSEDAFTIPADGLWHRNELELVWRGVPVNFWTFKVMGLAGEGSRLYIDEVKFFPRSLPGIP